MTSADKRRLGIYLHIPFCMSKCAYCDFYSYVPKNEQVYERYANALISHMEHYKSAASNCAPDSVYIGGGTPTALPKEQLLKIVRAVRKNFSLAKMLNSLWKQIPQQLTFPLFARSDAQGLTDSASGFNLQTKEN
ncbi:MAG: hypothetical protein IKL36_04545 [Clostridia bacterium]|nr:hypothetical protein [Clostridia bacterium]